VRVTTARAACTVNSTGGHALPVDDMVGQRFAHGREKDFSQVTLGKPELRSGASCGKAGLNHLHPA
jgi:hypothetical protein